MDGIVFIYENYPYIIALYGYYKAANTGYNTYQNGVKIYKTANGIYKWINKKNTKIQMIETIDISDTEDDELVIVSKLGEV